MENLDLNQNGTNSAGFGSGEQNAQNQGAQSSQNLQTQNAQSTTTQGVGQSQNQSQNAGQTQSTQGFQNQSDTQNAEQAQENASPKIQLLSEFLERQKRNGNEIESYIEQGRTIYMPKNERKKKNRVQQLKDLVECYDNINGDGKELISLELIDTSKVETMRYLFADSPRKNYKGIEKWDTSKVISLEGMFMKTDFNEDICGQEVTRNNRTYNSWDVSNARTFESMFYRASKFNQPIGQKWHTKSATNMISMFRFATNFNNGGKQFLKYKWRMDNVEWVQCMFWGAEKFNAPGLNEWNMSKVTKCGCMFDGAKSFNRDLSAWDLSSAWDLGHMFNKAESFNQDLSAWGDKLGKAQHMRKMFAGTKSLKVDFFSNWDIPEGCNTDDIIKGSALETTKDKSEIQVIKSNVRQESAFDNCKISIIPKGKEQDIYNLNLKADNEFLGEWIPQNILKEYKVFLAKIKQTDDDVGEGKISLDDLEQGNYKEWDFAFYKVFEFMFVAEKNDKELDFIDNAARAFKIEQSDNPAELEWDESDGAKARKYDNNLNILFDSRYISVVPESGASQKSVLAVLNAYILAKAYNATMQELGDKARQANEKRKDNKDSVNFFGKLRDKLPFSKARKESKALYDELKKSYEFVCNFDLHSYYNIPIMQNKLSDTSLVEIWRQISKTYMIQERHDELKERIEQITQLVISERREFKLHNALGGLVICNSGTFGSLACDIRY